MEDILTINIKREDLEDVFKNLKAIKTIRDSYEEEGNIILYERYLSEFVGIYCTLISLNLVNEWDMWQINHMD